MDSTRAIILERLRSAHSTQAGTHERGSAPAYEAIPREYQHNGSLDNSEHVELFEHRLKEYDAGVYYVAPENISSTIHKILDSRGKQNIVVPSGIPSSWLPEGFTFRIGDGITPKDLDEFDGVLTACTVAIALTGSIILQNSGGQGSRKLTLIPDYHLCIVFADQIVKTVPEAFDRLQPTATLPTTFISGPSATADIEMTRIKGVHGPRFLDVLVVKENIRIGDRDELREPP